MTCTQTPGLLLPSVPLGLHRLDAGMQVAGVDRGLDEHVLGRGQLLAQLAVFNSQGRQDRGHVVAQHLYHHFRDGPGRTGMVTASTRIPAQQPSA